MSLPKQSEAQLQKARWDKDLWERLQAEWGNKWQNLNNETLRRQFRLMSILGTAALPEDKLKQVS